MKKIKIFVILDAIVMAMLWALMDILDYVGRHNKKTYAGLSLRLGWDLVFAIIFLISSALLVLALCIIIIHKITQNMRRLKKFVILDGIVMIISWVGMRILSYGGMDNKRIYAGKYVSIGWELDFWIIFLVSSTLLILALCIIIIHKLVHKIKNINNRA